MDVDKLIASIEAYNKDIKKWTYRVRGKLARNVRSKASDGNGVLASRIRSSMHKDFGEIDSVSYKFPRHGVFYQKGVGRGHVMSGNRVIRGFKDGKVIRPLEGQVNRQSQDWFNATLDNEIPILADIVADHKADEAVVNANGMRIG